MRNQIVVAALVVALSACGQLLGTDGYGVAPRDAGPDPCDQCLGRNCSAELDACAADPACAQSIHCLGECEPGAVACQSDCKSRTGSRWLGGALVDITACQSRHCSEACSLPCGGICVGNPECDVCLASQCEAQARALTTAVDGMRLFACTLSTGEIVLGNDTCQTDLPTAAAAYDDWNACRNGVCGDFCAWGKASPDWSCVGRTYQAATSPIGTDAGTTIDVSVTLYPAGSAEGLQVKACRVSGVCSQEVTLGADGRTTLDLSGIPRSLVGFGLSHDSRTAPADG